MNKIGCLVFAFFAILFFVCALEKPKDMSAEVYCLGCQITVKELDFILKHKPTRGMGETVTRALRKVCDVHNFDKHELNANLTLKVCKHMITDEGMEAVLVTEYGRKHKMGVHKTYLDMTNLICGTVLGACNNVDIMGTDNDDGSEFDTILEDIKSKEGNNVKIAKPSREDGTKPATPKQSASDNGSDSKPIPPNQNVAAADDDENHSETTTIATITSDGSAKIDTHEEL